MLKALDNYTPKQISENGHVEYTWSNNIKEKIYQFYFQLTRLDDNNFSKLEKQLRELLTILFSSNQDNNVYYLNILYKMIAHTRDIINGKGEYTLTYMMILVWYDFNSTLAMYALECLVTEINGEHPYGSWKDMKKFCQYCFHKYYKEYDPFDNTHPLISHAIKLMNKQLKLDYENLGTNINTNISLVAKWIPRENSTHDWLFCLLAEDYFCEFLKSAVTHESKIKSHRKCYTYYRKLLSALNKKLDTLQIKQCNRKWSEIEFNNVTSISMTKQTNAFLNKNNKNTQNSYSKIDREICAKNFQNYVNNKINNNENIKGKRVSIVDFVKKALSLNISQDLLEIKILNSQWNDNAENYKDNNSFTKFIPMVDVSASMWGDPMHAAIGLGICIAEKSILGKRLMTFSAKPTWINLEPFNDNFVEKVQFIVKRADWGTNTNFNSALLMILNAIIENKLTQEDVEDMVLVILSDMQIDVADNSFIKFDNNSFYERIQTLYADAGIKVNGKPYNPPHILFWNLRSTSGFPSLSNTKNTSMLSGFSPVLLNSFCDKGIEALNKLTPWDMLETVLNNNRYEQMSLKLIAILS
jgi:hypothetical protein